MTDTLKQAALDFRRAVLNQSGHLAEGEFMSTDQIDAVLAEFDATIGVHLESVKGEQAPTLTDGYAVVPKDKLVELFMLIDPEPVVDGKGATHVFVNPVASQTLTKISKVARELLSAAPPAPAQQQNAGNYLTFDPKGCGQQYGPVKSGQAPPSNYKVPNGYVLVPIEPKTGSRYANGEWSRRNWEAALFDQKESIDTPSNEQAAQQQPFDTVSFLRGRFLTDFGVQAYLNGEPIEFHPPQIEALIKAAIALEPAAQPDLLREAVANLIKVKGRHHTEQAYQRLVAVYDSIEQTRGKQ